MSDTIGSGTSKVPVAFTSTNTRPTSKDYAAEIQRLELERLKLQTQPVSLPVMRMNTTSNVSVSVVETSSVANSIDGKES